MIAFSDESYENEYATVFFDPVEHHEESMHPTNTSHLFSHIQYEKSSDAMKEKIALKLVALRAKVEERTMRIAKLREEYKISDAMLIDLLMQARKAQSRNEARMSYHVSSMASGAENAPANNEKIVEIGAGTVNNLLTEHDFIESERTQIRDLELMHRNLADLPDERLVVNGQLVYRGHMLSAEALQYLGF